MSIRAIDSQMMITRAAELSRETGSEVNKSGIKHDYLATQLKATEEQEKSSVQKTEVSQQPNLLVGDEGREKGGYERRGKGTKKNVESSSEEPSLQVGQGEQRTIDITV